LLDEFADVLANCGQVTPGKPLEDVKLFLIDNPCYEKLNENDVIEVYDQYQDALAESSYEQKKLIENEAQYATIESLWNNESCCTLHYLSMDTEGLYRIPGNQNQAQDLEHIFQRNCYSPSDFDTLHLPVC
uniref:Rho GTPase-activating protein 35-like FF domain-containing protein n=1 Tax=Romanomermis culicivorax TaxID=13658 RepID=A0A915JUF9_ROMCU